MKKKKNLSAQQYAKKAKKYYFDDYLEDNDIYKEMEKKNPQKFQKNIQLLLNNVPRDYDSGEYLRKKVLMNDVIENPAILSKKTNTPTWKRRIFQAVLGAGALATGGYYLNKKLKETLQKDQDIKNRQWQQEEYNRQQNISEKDKLYKIIENLKEDKDEKLMQLEQFQSDQNQRNKYIAAAEHEIENLKESLENRKNQLQHSIEENDRKYQENLQLHKQIAQIQNELWTLKENRDKEIYKKKDPRQKWENLKNWFEVQPSDKQEKIKQWEQKIKMTKELK